jgi:hypothetical protein
MLRASILAALTLLSATAGAQPAELEIEGVFGECLPIWAATRDGLELYREPDLRSERVEIPYRAGWQIPAPKLDGLTRVLSIGRLRVRTPDPRMHCSIPPRDGPPELIESESVEYLYYVGEGFGEIRFRGGQCQAQVDEQFGHFESIELPVVQVWLKVFFADGTSPGWLLHDGSQTRVADVRC